MGRRSSRAGTVDKSGAFSSGLAGTGALARLANVPAPADAAVSPASLRSRTAPSSTSVRVRYSVALTRNSVPRTAAMPAGVRISNRPPAPARGLTRFSIAPVTSSSCSRWPPPSSGCSACTRRTRLNWRTSDREPSSNSSRAVDCRPVRSAVPGCQLAPSTAAWLTPSVPTTRTSPCSRPSRARACCSRNHATGMRNRVPGGISRSLRMPLSRASCTACAGVSRKRWAMFQGWSPDTTV